MSKLSQAKGPLISIRLLTLFVFVALTSQGHADSLQDFQLEERKILSKGLSNSDLEESITFANEWIKLTNTLTDKNSSTSRIIELDPTSFSNEAIQPSVENLLNDQETLYKLSSGSYDNTIEELRSVASELNSPIQDLSNREIARNLLIASAIVDSNPEIASSYSGELRCKFYPFCLGDEDDLTRIPTE